MLSTVLTWILVGLIPLIPIILAVCKVGDEPGQDEPPDTASGGIGGDGTLLAA